MDVNEKRKLLFNILGEVELLDSVRWVDWNQFYLGIERLGYLSCGKDSYMLSDDVYADVMDICANGDNVSSDDFSAMITETENAVKEELRLLGSAV